MANEKAEIDYHATMILVRNELIKHCGEEVANQMIDKLAKKLGIGVADLFAPEFPIEKVLKFLSGLWVTMFLESYYNDNCRTQTNPFHPGEDGDKYLTLLLYSWARYHMDLASGLDTGSAGPCYIYRSPASGWGPGDVLKD